MESAQPVVNVKAVHWQKNETNRKLSWEERKTMAQAQGGRLLTLKEARAFLDTHDGGNGVGSGMYPVRINIYEDIYRNE